ncbi:RNA-dependent RNA polymerase [Macrophomina phaseolina ourmia-like virus 2]|uniref:RNA-dependent RNA polymerase n=1 Tax=Macrophomina phaseolina ourmia-like virus 2 TaxID=2741644 RepID=A0ABX6TQN5_9VIRU|nr:RNA-dependent RNA polymerase [Macrophomina phaseolina ourmia-like virus 2]QOE55587.1 RNA-dependent RNA polymerase [Macrophomina phaseolina ourmia-like virus 2]
MMLNSTDLSLPSNCAYMNVETGGKSRGVTVNSARCLPLQPIHKLLYDHISRFDWLLRGEAKPGRFSSFLRTPGEVFVSGDYSSATDNLSLEVAEQILAAIFSRARSIPVHLQLEAFRSLRANVWYDDCNEPFVQTRGQLMGSFLSFPLLCLQNYLAFKFAVPRKLPVKINGDDIVFRAKPAEVSAWFDFCPRVGLKVHPTKTMQHRTFFSLNSAFFAASSSRVSLVPIVRMATLQKPVDSPAALAGGFGSFCRGWKGEGRVVVESVYLSFRRKVIRASGRSLVALGVRAKEESMRAAGLLRRELWFSQISAAPIIGLGGERQVGALGEQRLPPNPGKLKWAPLPEGWERVPLARSAARRRRQKVEEKDFWSEVVRSTWRSAPSRNQLLRRHWDEVRSTGLEGAYRDWQLRARKFRRLSLGLTCGMESSCHRRVCDPFRLTVGPRLRRMWEGDERKGRLVWRRVCREGEVRGLAAIAFQFGERTGALCQHFPACEGSCPR